MDRLNEVIRGINLTNEKTVSALSKLTDVVNKHADEINKLNKAVKTIADYINQTKK